MISNSVSLIRKRLACEENHRGLKISAIQIERMSVATWKKVVSKIVVREQYE